MMAQTALAVSIAAVLLIAGGREVPPGEVERALSHATPGLMAAAAIAALGFVAARAWRYGALLFPHGPRPLAALVTITLAAWGPGLVLPGVASDAAFVWLARSRLGVEADRGVAAALVARLLDIVSLLLVGLVSAPLAGVVLPGSLYLAGTAAALGAAGVTAGLLWAPTRRSLLALPARVPRLRRTTARLDAALALTAGPGAIAELVMSTVAARACTALMYMALFAAVGHALGFWQSWFALSIRTLLLALPFQGVGGLGTTQLWWVTALVLLGEPVRSALAVGISVHLLDLTLSLSLAALGWLPLISLRRAILRRS